LTLLDGGGEYKRARVGMVPRRTRCQVEQMREKFDVPRKMDRLV
jgi:hypothetical protein